jgi:peptidoglycan/xylan/chitin deacetylase (PgdA/CDA1 family)
VIPPAEIGQRLANLHAWLETMRQPGGYGGPVTHWWRCTHLYAGPGLDWRYEGILSGYALLFEKTGDESWRQLLNVAAEDLLEGQLPSGSFRNSQFELNPGTLGTPHEAAAVDGLIRALPHLNRPQSAIDCAERCLVNMLDRLKDGDRPGVNDEPGVFGRVPNKEATLALALLHMSAVTGDRHWLDQARRLLDDVMRYQVSAGRFAGAIHQTATEPGVGDGRFFPYYAARCVEPLVAAAATFQEGRYRNAAHGVLDFLRNTAKLDGSWPQICYASNATAEWPVWIAGASDIIRAFIIAGSEPPTVAIDRLLRSQTASGAFPTGYGFISQASQADPSVIPDIRSRLPVVGWNDKAFRLLAELLPRGGAVPASTVVDASDDVLVEGKLLVFSENPTAMMLGTDRNPAQHVWRKQDPWLSSNARILTEAPRVVRPTHESARHGLFPWTQDLVADMRVVHQLPRTVTRRNDMRRRLESVGPLRIDMKPLVALTFDIERDLPGPFESSGSSTAEPFLQRFLDLAAKLEIPATFLVQGEMIPGLSSVLHAAVPQGHEVGLHGFRHEFWGWGSWTKHLAPITVIERERRLRMSKDYFATAGLPPPRSFRAPNFSISAQSRRLLEQFGFTVELSDTGNTGQVPLPRQEGRLRRVPTSASPVPRLIQSPRWKIITAARFPQLDHSALTAMPSAELDVLTDEVLGLHVASGILPHAVMYSHNWEMIRDGPHAMVALGERLESLRERRGAEFVTATTLADRLFPDPRPPS